MESVKLILRNLSRRVAGLPTRRTYVSLDMGKCTSLDPNLEIHAGTLAIGDYTYFGPGRISSLPETRITVGRFTSVAAGVQIIGALHRSHLSNYSFTRLLPSDQSEALRHGTSRGDIAIGNDVWIGTNAIVLSGVTIGDGAVIGAGAVVTNNIPPYCVAVGVPAQVQRKRFSDEDIALLLELRWWDWEFERIERNARLFYDETLSVRDFIATAE